MRADALLVDDGRGRALERLVRLRIGGAAELVGLVPLQALAEQRDRRDCRGGAAELVVARDRALHLGRLADDDVAPARQRHDHPVAPRLHRPPQVVEADLGRALVVARLTDGRGLADAHVLRRRPLAADRDDGARRADVDADPRVDDVELGVALLHLGRERVLVRAADAGVHADHLALPQDGDLGHPDVARAVPEPAPRVREDRTLDRVQVRHRAREEVGDVLRAGHDAVVALHLDGRAVVVLRAVAVDARGGLDELQVRQRAGLLLQAELLVDLGGGDRVLHLRRDARHAGRHLGAEVEEFGRRSADEGGELDLVERRLADDQRGERDRRSRGRPL